jgi:hypothetical protein
MAQMSDPTETDTDVVKAAREVVIAHKRWDEMHTEYDDYGTLDTLSSAVAKLDAVLPKED